MPRLSAIQSDFQQHLTVQRRIHGLARDGDSAAATAVLNQEDTPLWRRYKQQILDLRDQLDREAAAVATANERLCAVSQALSWLCGLLLAAAGLGAILAARFVCHRLREASSLLDASARRVADVAGQVSQSSQQLASGSTETAASLEQTSAAAEQIHAMAQNTGAHSENAATLVVESSSKLAETN